MIHNASRLRMGTVPLAVPPTRTTSRDEVRSLESVCGSARYGRMPLCPRTDSAHESTGDVDNLIVHHPKNGRPGHGRRIANEGRSLALTHACYLRRRSGRCRSKILIDCSIAHEALGLAAIRGWTTHRRLRSPPNPEL